MLKTLGENIEGGKKTPSIKDGFFTAAATAVIATLNIGGACVSRYNNPDAVYVHLVGGILAGVYCYRKFSSASNQLDKMEGKMNEMRQQIEAQGARSDGGSDSNPTHEPV